MSPRLHGWSRRALASALCLALALAPGKALAQTGSPSPAATAVVDLKVWRTVTLGTRRGVNAYREALETAAVKIGDSANEVLGRPGFAYAAARRDVELVRLTGRELGMEAAEPLASFYQRARRAGLELCPAEAGPQLRLAYSNQPRGEVLHIAMEPVATWAGAPIILALANFGTLMLMGSNGRADFMVPRDMRFVFAVPDKRPLQALTR